MEGGSVSAAAFHLMRVSPASLGHLLVVHPQTPRANSGIAAQTEVRQMNWILPEQKDPYSSGELEETAAGRMEPFSQITDISRRRLVLQNVKHESSTSQWLLSTRAE